MNAVFLKGDGDKHRSDIAVDITLEQLDEQLKLSGDADVTLLPATVTEGKVDYQHGGHLFDGTPVYVTDGWTVDEVWFSVVCRSVVTDVDAAKLTVETAVRRYVAEHPAEQQLELDFWVGESVTLPVEAVLLKARHLVRIGARLLMGRKGAKQ